MRERSSFVSSLVSLAGLAFTVATVIHFFTTDTVVLHRLADDTICTGQRAPCLPQFTLLQWNMLGISVSYATPYNGIVQCRRSYLLVGDYACAVLNPPAVVWSQPSSSAVSTASAAPSPARPRPSR